MIMNGKECRTARLEIDESELNQQLSDQTRRHVSQCASCRGFRAERTSLRELVGSLEPVVAPGDFEMRLRARMASERQGRARQPFIFRLVGGAPAVVAAALLVGLALTLVWFAQRNTQTPEIARVPIKAEANVPKAAVVPETALVEPNTPGTLDTKPDRQLRAGNPGREFNSKAGPGGISANDYGLSAAASIKQIEQRAGEVSLSAPLKPMVVSMEDDRGATRRISLPPVSFGAQRLVDNHVPVSSTSNSRSW